MTATVTESPAMKKVLNQPDTLVEEMGEGMALAHPDLLRFDRANKTLYRASLNSKKVTLLSGGGSGHEPAHGGYVGPGLLDAAICGDVFASPSTMQVYRALLESGSEAGSLLIIKNYSGDCMNFEAAAEMAEEDDGLTVRRVYVKDDVAVSKENRVGRRGVAGTLFVHKVAGALAEQGKDLETIQKEAQAVADATKSLGFAFSSCTVSSQRKSNL